MQRQKGCRKAMGMARARTEEAPNISKHTNHERKPTRHRAKTSGQVVIDDVEARVKDDEPG
jgi:hypothetical protein